MSTPETAADPGEDVIEDYAYVISSSYREAVLLTLDDAGPVGKRPVSIADETNIEIAHASRALGQLRESGLVELLVGEDVRKGRMYGLTDRGEQITPYVREEGA